MEPEDYTIGWKPFLGCKVRLDTRPLIPRPETEWWTEKAILEIQKKKDAPATILDMCAGSGCIGIAVLKLVRDTHVTFSDIEQKHFETIRKSLAENNIDPARASFVHADMWDGIDGTFDFVLTNPPYLARSRSARIDPDVLKYEPHEALFAEEEGFELIRRALLGAPDALTAGGKLWVEHEPEHEESILTLSNELGLKCTVHRDQFGLVRYSVILGS